MEVLAWAVYGFLGFIALTNLLLMLRPGRKSEGKLLALVPARNEEANLARLVPSLIEQGFEVIVNDDGSSDDSARVAADAGATVVKGIELPPGWTGKNHACHQLAKVATEASNADLWVFLDADVVPKKGFADALRDLSRRAPVVTGFPQMLPGRGIEPLFLAWVGWILVATNPFGIVSRSRMGHNRFLNGQFVAWKPTVYTDLWPHQQVKGVLLEDVIIGRLLARHGVRVEVANVSDVLAVRMYDHWRQTLDGMSKNSYEITGNALGTIALSLLMLVFGWLWLAAPWTLVPFVASGLAVVIICRAPVWPILFMPIAATIGSFTMLRSLWWRLSGRTVWKGRTY